MAQDYDELLSDRAQLLLRVLVDNYIRDGQPVGSRALSRDSGLSLSSATIRNVMADLEELGYVASPHTSAGRVPTDRGYRFFVDTLLRRGATIDDGAEEVRRHLEPAAYDTPMALVENASQVLSNVTRLAGVVTIPLLPLHSISQIEFVGLAEDRILVVIVYNDREVQNRIIQATRHHSPEELRRASNYLNEQVRGRTPAEARADILRQLQDARESMNELMVDAIQLAQQGLPPDRPAGAGLQYVIAGETNLMGAAHLTSVEKLKRLFEAFNEKRDFLQLLDQTLHADGVHIFIGHESGFQVLDDCSVVTAPYRGDDGVVGVLGVIGPTRMAYERVIPIVDLTAKILSAALNSHR
jgi:heat-inducible transcriptional repressor